MAPRSRPTPPHDLEGQEEMLLPRLLWAACHDRSEHAIAAGRLQLVAALETGAWLYDPRAHALRPLLGEDLRIARGSHDPQRGFELVYVATMPRHDPAARRPLAAVDAAIVGARVERLCTARGLWLRPRGPIEARVLEICLPLLPPRFVSFVQSIGWTDDDLPTDAEMRTPTRG